MNWKQTVDDGMLLRILCQKVGKVDRKVPDFNIDIDGWISVFCTIGDFGLKNRNVASLFGGRMSQNRLLCNANFAYDNTIKIK